MCLYTNTNENMRKLLMLGTSLSSIEMIEYAKSKGVYTIVTDYLEPNKSRAKLISDEYWMINTGDLDLLEQKCREQGVNAVVCGVSEFNLEMTMELCNRLNLPCYCTKEAWHFSRDKSDFKKLCKAKQVPLPDDYLFGEELNKKELRNIKYPVVVKPVDLSGNRGITYCYNEEELIKAYKYARSVSKNPKIIIERMLEGKEWYSYYAISNGEIRQISLNAMEAQPGELKNLYSLTTTVTDCVERFMEEINPKIEEVLKAIGCREGIAWVQVMLDKDDKFYVIEMGYRLPGDLPYMVYPEILGFDSISWIVDYALGEKRTTDFPKRQQHQYKKCGCGYSLWTHMSGTIKEFIGFDEVKKIEGVNFYTLYQEGDSFVKHRPLGVVTVSADTIDDFCEKIEKINETISIIGENNEDVIIRYTDFEYLKKTYLKGLHNEN